MKKNKLNELKRLTVTRVSHPARVEDPDTGEVTYKVSYLLVNGSSSKRYTRECTKQVFARCYGVHPDGDPNTLPVGGLSTMIGRKFYVYISGGKEVSKQKIEAVSSIPESLYSSAKEAPVAAAGLPGLELQFISDGSFDVVYRRTENGAEIPSIPIGMDQAELDKVTAALDTLEEVEAGHQLYSKYYVREANGTRVIIVS